jgi:hypothetical protein
MADFVATIDVLAGQTVWRADEVPHLTADALYRFEPEPDPMMTKGDLRHFTSADVRSRAAGRALSSRELKQFACECKAAGLPELPDGLPYRRWGEYLEAFNRDADMRGWWAGLIPPRDPHHAERLEWTIAAEEHRKLLKDAIASGGIQARMAGTLVPASAGMVNLHRLVLTREGLEQFAAMLAMRVVDSLEAGSGAGSEGNAHATVNLEPVPDRGRRLKRAALIEDNVRRWPTIERDLKDAAANGLSEAAKDGAAVGWWWEGSAIEWARARAKVRDVAAGLAGVTSTIHRMRG